MSKFVSTLSEGITKLKGERSALMQKQMRLHECDCPFCTYQEKEKKAIKEELHLIDDELARMERYKNSVD